MPEREGVRFSTAHGIDGKAAAEEMRARLGRGESLAPVTPITPTLAPLTARSSDAVETGRPPVPWRISGSAAIDMINDDGATNLEVARAVGVSDRTLTRVLRRCGFVIAAHARSDQYAEWLPGARCHHVDELADLRRHLRSTLDTPMTRHWFADRLFIRRSLVDGPSRDYSESVWHQLDQCDHLEARGRSWADEYAQPLPGDHGSRYGVRADRPDTKTTRPRLPRPDRKRGGRPARYTMIDAHRELVVRRYVEDGETIAQLADDYDTSQTTLHRRLRAWGVEMRPAAPRGGGARNGTELRFPDHDEVGGVDGEGDDA